MNIKRNILLNPGPATTTDTVKMAQVVPDICPREEEFGQVMEFVSKGLTELVGSNNEYTTVLFGGSGTAAVESIISSVVDDNEILLIINNGAYGKRICKMAEIYKLKYIELQCSKVKRMDINYLENITKKFNLHMDIDLEEKNNAREENVILHNIDKESLFKYKIKHLSVVHHETTTGILNDSRCYEFICWNTY